MNQRWFPNWEWNSENEILRYKLARWKTSDLDCAAAKLDTAKYPAIVCCGEVHGSSGKELGKRKWHFIHTELSGQKACQQTTQIQYQTSNEHVTLATSATSARQVDKQLFPATSSLASECQHMMARRRAKQHGRRQPASDEWWPYIIIIYFINHMICYVSIVSSCYDKNNKCSFPD